MIRALIIEDEAPLRELLSIIIREVDDEITVIGECENIKAAAEAIEELEPDLIFLDIILPGGTGFDLLERIPPGLCEVIFITAYDSYALEAIKHSAIGYVLKPVDKDDLRVAITNAKRRIRAGQNKVDYAKLFDHIRHAEGGSDKIALPTPEGFLFVKAGEIIRCESDKVYTWIYMEGGKKILCSYNIGEFRRTLPEYSFFQVHKSHIISIPHVRSYNGKDNTVELTDGTIVPVSRRNKASFLNNFRVLTRNLE
jgi:two-component system LytT family response regulator